jgi:nitroimidazol reductase NimA-like FMN-containing flavoprotein (pyridoxamine 5'-phosphate oxidase superfamily)
MADERSVEMGMDELTEFLGTGGTGVISFQTSGTKAPYSRPVSYGYDGESDRFYFRLAFSPESGKRDALLDLQVSFVTYDERDGVWHSVVVTGTLDEIDDDHLDTEVLDGMRRIHIPLYDVFEAESKAVQYRFFALEPTSLTGRKEVLTVE